MSLSRPRASWFTHLCLAMETTPGRRAALVLMGLTATGGAVGVVATIWFL